MKTYDILNAGPRNCFMANGRIVSNSGRAIQLQNLVRNDLTTLDEARELIKMGCFDMVASIYGNVPDILSQLIRTMLIPKHGCEFIMVDFSAIEARVLAHLAGEQWRLDAFKRGDDIYCASASAMFGVPVVKHGINGELRAKGKIAELACIAEGQLVLTDKGLVPIEDVTVDMKIWDGEEWVSHDGVIFKGEREVITYEGLTATPDHLVYIEGESKPIYFGIAATSRIHLIQTGDGRRTIWLGKNHKPRKKMETKKSIMLCPNSMSRMWFNTVDINISSKIWTIKRLSKLFTAMPSSKMAISKATACKRPMRKNRRSRILQLWRKRNQIRVSKYVRCWPLFNETIWRNSGQEYGSRQNRQQWKLCTRQYTICKLSNKLRKYAENCLNPLRTTILALLLPYYCPKTFKGDDKGRDHSRSQICNSPPSAQLEEICAKTRVYDIRNAGRHHRFTVSGHLVHNCGYGGGVGALKAFGASDMGLSEEKMAEIIGNWRAANPAIVKFWWELEGAAIQTIRDHQERNVGKIGIRFYANTLWLILPSGRSLAYISPTLEPNRFGTMSMTFMGLNAANKWSRTESYGGRLAENVTQSTARDVLAEAMWRMEKQGLDIVSHIHDEIVLEVPRDSISVEAVCRIMNQSPAWAEGLPLSSAGYKGDFYYKD